MNWLSLRNNQLTLETSRELSIVLEESIDEYTSNEWKQNRKMSTCNRLDLESLGSWPTMSKNFLGIGFQGLTCVWAQFMPWPKTPWPIREFLKSWHLSMLFVYMFLTILWALSWRWSYPLSLSKRDKTMGYILLWKIFLLRAFRFVMYRSVLWKLGEIFRTSSFHLSNYGRILRIEIGYAPGIRYPKSRIGMCKARLARPS